MPEPLHAYIGLGSNLGDRLAALQRALDLMVAAARLEVRAVSQVYETAPWGYLSEHMYLNAVVECFWGGPPLHLQELCYRIESSGGRHRMGVNPPRYYLDRTIDLDLLYIEGINSKDARLSLPHPRAHLRGFVLAPLAELAPGLELEGQTVEYWLKQLDRNERAAIQRYGELRLQHN
jgi:2-amino-4-hydroxy-6-hydroxymethyldihydropteridine diphosphokinase